MIPPFAIDGAGIGSMLRIHEEFKRLAIPPARLERRTYGLVKGELSTELAAALAEVGSLLSRRDSARWSERMRRYLSRSMG